MVMALGAGGQTPDEIIVIDQTTSEDRNPVAFAALTGHERRGLCRVIECHKRPIQREICLNNRSLYSGSTAG